VTGECRKLHNEELYDLYCSPNIFPVRKSRMKCVGHVAYRALVGRSEVKRPLGRPESGWRDNIKTDFQ
jgi:hypothetical protein